MRRSFNPLKRVADGVIQTFPGLRGSVTEIRDHEGTDLIWPSKCSQVQQGYTDLKKKVSQATRCLCIRATRCL